MHLLFWKPKGEQDLRLSIGAPSSPYLSNAIMFSFDNETQAMCNAAGVIYTRYADDMSFSMGDKSLRSTIRDAVARIVDRLAFPHLQINDHKTVYGSKAHRRTVTGLTLTNDGTVSIGRDRKRRIRAKIHNYLSGSLPEEERDGLRGFLAFARNVEPTFVQRMERKYGLEALRTI